MLTAREVLGMDSNGVMAIGIGALQKILKTLKYTRNRVADLESITDAQAIKINSLN